MSLVMFLIFNAAGVAISSYYVDISSEETACRVVFSTLGALNYAFYLYISRSK